MDSLVCPALVDVQCVTIVSRTLVLIVDVLQSREVVSSYLVQSREDVCLLQSSSLPPQITTPSPLPLLLLHILLQIHPLLHLSPSMQKLTRLKLLLLRRQMAQLWG